jgi:uncharacterized membrane protein YozB (DUF420 family)
MTWLPALNASMNACCCTCLCLGLWLIKRGRREAHERAMLGATLFGALFLVGYLVYHFGVQASAGPTKFHGAGLWRPLYYGMLISHVVLAGVNVPLVVMTLVRARRKDWVGHKKIAKITWPVWFYVSVTGILVYFALYHWNPPAPV